jgi:FkbM family methyltransferase
MALKRTLLSVLDRPGGRPLLAKLGTSAARRRTGADIELLYRDLWVHRVGRHYFPDGERFEYFTNHFPKMVGEGDRYLARAKEYWFHFYRPSPGDVIVDIGAGCGEDALAFSEAVGPTGRVLAIESHPATFRRLQAFCAMNGLRNTKPLGLALMGHTGEVSVVESSFWRGHAVSWDASTPGQQVTALTLDRLRELEGIDEIAFLKMNIEGGERDAVQGMTGSMPRIRELCIACHDFRAERGEGEQYRTRAVVEEFLRDHGFEVRVRDKDPRPYVRDHIFGTRRG